MRAEHPQYPYAHACRACIANGGNPAGHLAKVLSLSMRTGSSSGEGSGTSSQECIQTLASMLGHYYHANTAGRCGSRLASVQLWWGNACLGVAHSIWSAGAVVQRWSASLQVERRPRAAPYGLCAQPRAPAPAGRVQRELVRRRRHKARPCRNRPRRGHPHRARAHRNAPQERGAAGRVAGGGHQLCVLLAAAHAARRLSPPPRSPRSHQRHAPALHRHQRPRRRAARR